MLETVLYERVFGLSLNEMFKPSWTVLEKHWCSLVEGLVEGISLCPLFGLSFLFGGFLHCLCSSLPQAGSCYHLLKDRELHSDPVCIIAA